MMLPAVARPGTATPRLGRRSGPARSTRRPDPVRGRHIVEGFLAAARSGDLDGLKALLREDVTVLTDGGGKFSAALRPIHESAETARLRSKPIPYISLLTTSSTFSTLSQIPGLSGRSE